MTCVLLSRQAIRMCRDVSLILRSKWRQHHLWGGAGKGAAAVSPARLAQRLVSTLQLFLARSRLLTIWIDRAERGDDILSFHRQIIYSMLESGSRS